jgi:hypothetical protein
MIYASGFLAVIGVLMMLTGYSNKFDDDDEGSGNLFLAGMSVALFGMFSLGVFVEGQSDKRVKHQVKPSIEITIKDGKTDTTYIYNFE